MKPTSFATRSAVAFVGLAGIAVLVAATALTGCPTIRCDTVDNCLTGQTCVDGLCVAGSSEGEGEGTASEGEGGEGEGDGEGEGAEGEGAEGEGEGAEGEGEGEGEGAPGQCIDTCGVNADCTEIGTDVGQVCSGGSCVLDACVSDVQCRVTLLDGVRVHCADDSICPSNTCVDVGGAGFCAVDVRTACPVPGTEITGVTDIDGTTKFVCAFPTAICDTGVCRIPPCTSDAQCPSFAPACDVATATCRECTAVNTALCQGNTPACVNNQCGCSADPDCVGVGAGGVCDVATGRCSQCALDADCNNLSSKKCIGGFCGCASSANCTPAHDATVATCQ